MTIDSRTYYDEHQADPRSVFEDIEAGIRIDPIYSCQYFIKGLSGLCKYWDTSTDRCIYDTTESSPSGYNAGNCDYLGRRTTCDKYECKTITDPDTGEEVNDEDLEKYWCIAPNMFLSGLGKRINTGSDAPLLSPIPKSEILGYCNGNCDGQGRGTGCGGEPGVTPIICSYYRPFQLGFGADEPHQLEYEYVDDRVVIKDEALENAYATAGDPLGSRLPFSFKLYNLRAYMQKCAYWDSDYGSRFEVNTTVSGACVRLDVTQDPSVLCTCTEEAARPYSTYATEAPGGITAWLLKDVWSDANTVICNGAKPECPCYTGKWNYLNDEKMLEGMRITAAQALELRFWTSDWGSQEEYDLFFTEIPNFQDAARALIYTYTSLERMSTPDESIMKGKKYDMCMPAPINHKEFILEDYVEISDYTYPRLGIDPGTTVPTEGQVYYPNLIRDPDVASSYIRPLDIIYPYFSLSPFEEAICEDRDIPFCVKRGCLMENDSLSVIGSTVRRSTVYALNLTAFQDIDYMVPELLTHWTVSTISDVRNVSTDNDTIYEGFSPKEKFFMRIPDFLAECYKINPMFITEGTADDYGFFKLDSINIMYQQRNVIIIFVLYSDNTWDFRKRPVWGQWYGGVVVQDSFNYEIESRTLDTRPIAFNGAEITGRMLPFTAPASEHRVSPLCYSYDLISFASSCVTTGSDFSQYWKYGYCIKKIIVSDEQVDTWGRIGNTSKIWVDITQDTNLNHIFEWDVDSAKMIFVVENTTVCGDSIEVEMEVESIEAFVSGNLSVTPTARILKPVDDSKKFGFFNSDWILRVTYWYKSFSNTDEIEDNEEIVFPDFENPLYSFRGPSFIIERDTNLFTISNIRWDTVAVMGYFNSEDGRLISCMATKMLTQVVTLDCRNVDIKYSYAADAIGYRIMPETSASTLATIRSPDLQFEVPPLSYAPPCGDHEGPRMWYPFSSCEQMEYYQEFAGGAWCTNAYQDTPRDDLRFCTPPLYKGWVSAGSASAYADCVLSFWYRYTRGKTPTQSRWTGAGRIVAYVDLAAYDVAGWTPPPFGNKGREFVERYLCSDFHHHLTYKGVVRPASTVKYVPLVPNYSDFYFSFNSFDQDGINGLDDFSYISQINFLKSNLVSEVIQEDDRLRWDEVYNVRRMFQTTYPLPLITTGSIQLAVHYNFIEEDTAWAWRECWKDIEFIESKVLFFVDYEKPDYKYGIDKDEHRYICDEDEYTIYYKAPIIEDSVFITFPSVKLGENGKERWFEVRYDDYNSDYVEWKDEDSGEVGGSGGDADGGGQGNIYERTLGSEWNHDEHILFDEDAVDTISAAESAGRIIQELDDMLELATFYYNRGLIAHIKKNSLQYLPYEDSEFIEDTEITNINTEPDFVLETALPRIGISDVDRIWYNESFVVEFDVSELSMTGGCVAKLEIVGKWGIKYIRNFDVGTVASIMGGYSEDLNAERRTDGSVWMKYSICKPGITVKGVTNGSEETLYTLDEVEYDIDFYPDLGYDNFKLEIPLQPNINRMFNEPEQFIKIEFSCVTNQFIFLNTNSIKMYVARYVDSTERIKVYERKYIRSKGSNFGSLNINGPKQMGEVSYPLQRELQEDNSGSYFAVSPTLDYGYKGVIQARDKLRGFYSLEQHTENEDLDIDMSTLVTTEETEQMFLYQSAYISDIDGDTWNYSLICPPQLVEFFANYEITGAAEIAGNVQFVSQKYVWEDHYLYGVYNSQSSHAFWQPLGHIYKWSDRVVYMRCYEFVPSGGTVDYATVLRVYPVYEVVYVHLDIDSDEVPSDPYTALYANRIFYQMNVVANLTGSIPLVEGGPYGVATTFQDDPLADS